MDKDFFKKTRILDGGMGQELLKKGLKPQGTLWSASALIEDKYANGPFKQENAKTILTKDNTIILINHT